MKEVYSPQHCYISVELDMEAIEQLKLNVDAYSVRSVLLHGTRGVTRSATLRAIKEHHVLIKRGSTSKFRVLVPTEDEIKSKPYFALQLLKASLPEVIVQGIPSIQRAVINESEKGSTPTYNLLMEGYGLQEVMGSPVSGSRSMVIVVANHASRLTLLIDALTYNRALTDCKRRLIMYWK
jgi:DNA-directed RNA polymerase III subunit RPC1